MFTVYLKMVSTNISIFLPGRERQCRVFWPAPSEAAGSGGSSVLGADGPGCYRPPGTQLVTSASKVFNRHAIDV